jgi:hypothetical protein
MRQGRTYTRLVNLVCAFFLFAIVIVSSTLWAGDVSASASNVPGQATVQEESVVPKQSDWRFFVSLYGWLAGVEGTVVNAGQGVDIDVPFSDILEKTTGGLMFYAEARWRKWFAAFDGT